MVGLVPMALLGYSIYHGEHEQILGMSSFTFGLIVIGSGFVFYAVDRLFRPAQPPAERGPGSGSRTAGVSRTAVYAYLL